MTLDLAQDAPRRSMQRLVRVVWSNVETQSGMKSGPFTMWLIDGRLFHLNTDGTVGYFCGFPENATIFDATIKAHAPMPEGDADNTNKGTNQNEN